jgi:hypothetical protein
VISTEEAAPDPFSAIDGVTLVGYVDVCRALVRTAGDSARRVEEVLAAHNLTLAGWLGVNEAWLDRIRRHPTLRAEFRRLYAGSSDELPAGNE